MALSDDKTHRLAAVGVGVGGVQPTEGDDPAGDPEGSAPQDDARVDLELFTRAQHGDYEAFEQVVRRYQDRIYRLAYGMTRSRTEAQEVAQEAFLRAFQSLASFKADAAPATWLFRIAINAALMRLRASRRKPLLSLEDIPGSTPALQAPGLWPSGDWARQPDDQLDTRELRDRIEKVIASLPEKYRLVLLLRDVEGQSTEQVAQTLGLTVPTVKARLHRSRLIVRQQLESYFGNR